MDAILITNPINVRYLSGFRGNDSVLLVRSSGAVLLSDARFTLQIEEECSGLENVYIRAVGEGMSTALAKVLGSTTKRLGVESETLTLGERDRIQAKLPGVEFVPVKNAVEVLRQIKDRSEVDAIRRAVAAAAKGFDDIRAALKPDQTEIDVRNEIEYRMRLHGAEEKSFASIIAAGPRAALPHGIPSGAKVGDHPLLLVDWGAIVDGYMSDLTRVIVLKPTKKLRTVYETVLKAQAAAIAAIKPGKICSEIDAVARNIIKDAGYGKCFGHGLGHGLGLEIHESPRFNSVDETVLKPGMVLTVEPGIYLKDWGGVRIEDDVLITKTGCEVLSRHVEKSFDGAVQ